MMKQFAQIVALVLISSFFFQAIVSAQYHPAGFEKAKVNLWFDASDSSKMTGATSGITRWQDLTGNHVASQTASAYYPILNIQNGKNLVEFNGKKVLDIPYSPLLVPNKGFYLAQTLYVYQDAPLTASDFRIGTFTCNNAGYGNPFIGVRYNTALGKYVLGLNLNSSSLIYNQYKDLRGTWLCASEYVPSTLDYAYMFQNAGGSLKSSKLPDYKDYNLPATLGNRNAYYSDVHYGISETVLLGYDCGASGRKLLDLYLATKWGLLDTLQNGYGPIYYYPSDLAFKNKLVGIGTEGGSDSVSCTRSNNGLGFQNINSNDGFLREPGDYLMAADNGLSGVTTIGTNFLRWNRSWYIQKTDVGGYGGNLYIDFDFKSYNLQNQLDTVNNDYYLIYNPNNGYYNSSNNYVIPILSKTIVSVAEKMRFLLDAENISNGFYTLSFCPKGTPVNNISLYAPLSPVNLTVTPAPLISSVFSGNTYNYIMIDSTSINYAIAYYKLYVSINGGAFQLFDSTKGTTTYYAHYNITNGQTYSYQISAVYAHGKESILSDTAIGVPSFFSPKWQSQPQYSGSGRIFMQGNQPWYGLPIKYYFEHVSSGGHNSNYQNSFNFTDTGLLNGNYSYHYKIYDTIKGLSTLSDWSPTKSVLLADSAKGGFTYNLAYLNPYSKWAPYGIGPSTLTPATQDMSSVRMVKHVPLVGVHPRMYCNPEDRSEILWRLKNTNSGKQAARWIHAYTILLQKGIKGYNRNSWYAKDTLGNSQIVNYGIFDVKGIYDSLAAGDIGILNNYKNYFGNNAVKLAYVLSMEAMECWLYQGTYDTLTGTNYSDRALKLANAMTIWASKALSDSVPLNYANRNNLGAVYYAYMYDFIQPFMTKNQNDTIREAIMRVLPDSSQMHGFMTPSYTYTTNWATFGYEIIPDIIVEGEQGFKQKDTGAIRNWVRSCWNFLTYGVYDKTGNVFEGLGKDQLNLPLLYALSKRGYSMLGHPSVKSFGAKYLPAILQPFGYSSVGTDLLGGTGDIDPAAGGWRQNAIDPIGLKWVFPTDTAVDFVWKNYMQKSIANVPYVKNITPTFYNYAPLSDNFGVGFNLRIPALLFALDYFPTPFAQEAASAFNNNKMYFDSLGGFATLRSGFDSTAMTIYFANRQDLGGHTYANKNEILLSALGRIWIPRPTTHSNSQWSNTAFTGASSGILINGFGASIDTSAFNTSLVLPAKMVYYNNNPSMLSIAGDARKAYAYKWPSNIFGYQGDNPKLNPPYVVKVMESQNSFRYSPNYAHDLVPFYNTLAFVDGVFTKPFYQRFVETTSDLGMVKKLFRTISLVQAPVPFTIVADDVQKDNSINQYQWICQVPSDLSIESKFINLKNINYRRDIILKEPTLTGNRRLLVRVLNVNGALSDTVAATIDSAVYSFTSMRRMVIDSKSIDPQFKVLLFAYHVGDSLPITSWSPDHSKVYVYHKGVTNTISFKLDSAGRTNILLNSPDTGTYWTGAKDTNWFNAANWGNYKVPAATDNVIIPVNGVTNMPVVTSLASANSMIVYKGATVTVYDSLQLNGDLIALGNVIGDKNGNGVLKTSSTSSTPITEDKTWNINIEFNASIEKQYLPKGIYNRNLSITSNNGGTIKIANDSIVVNGRIFIGSTDTLNMDVYKLSGNFNTCYGNGGVVATQSTVDNCLPSGINWMGKVIFNNPNGSQSISGGIYQNLSISTNYYKSDTVLGDIQVIDTLSISRKATLDMGIAKLYGNLNVILGRGWLKTANTSSNPIPDGKSWSYNLVFYSNSSQTIVPGQYANLDLSGGGFGDRNLGVSGVSDSIFTVSGTLLPPKGICYPNASTLNYNGNNQEVAAMQYHNLDLTGAFGAIYNQGEIKIAGTFTPALSTNSWGVGTITFNGSDSQYIPLFSYNNLGIKGNRSASVGICPSLTLTGNFDCSGLSFSHGKMNGKGSSLTLSGSFPQSIKGTAINIDNLILACKNGNITLLDSSNLTVNNQLITNSGNFLLKNAILQLPNLNVISTLGANGYLATDSLSRIIIGSIDSSKNKIPIGANSSYTPLTFSCDTTASISFSANKFPTYAVSNFNKIVNIQWVISSNRNTNANIIFRFNADDTAKNFSVDSPCQIGSYDTAYLLYNVGQIKKDTMSYYTQLQKERLVAGTYYYHLIADSGNISNCTNGQWLGLNMADANFSGNWCGGLPTSTSKVVIANTTPKMTNNLSFGNMSLATGIDLNGFALTINGNVSGTGTIKGSPTSSLIANGTGTIYFDQTLKGYTNALSNLILNSNGTLSLGNSLNIYSKFIPLTGVLAAGNNLTLIANSKSAARVLAGNPNGGYLTGNVRAQTYIPAKSMRAIDLLGSPVTQTIRNGWQGQIYITGNGTGGSICGIGTARYNSNGFDVSAKNSPNIFTFNSTANANGSHKVSIANTNNGLLPGKGYFVVIYGNRATGSCTNQMDSINNAPPTDVILQPTGPLAQGKVNAILNNPVEYGYSLVANPYLCPISFDALAASNTSITPKMWIYKPLGNGNFTTYCQGLAVNVLDSLSDANVNILDANQGFFVEAANTDTILNFNESIKVDSTIAHTTFFGTNNSRLIKLQLHTITDSVLDETALRFNSNGQKNYSQLYDAYSFQNGSNSLAFSKQNIPLAIATLPLSSFTDTIEMYLKSSLTDNYRISATSLVGMDSVSSIILYDKYLQVAQNLQLKPNYDFSITADSMSKGNRFQLRLGKNIDLPIKYVSLSYNKIANTIKLKWSTQSNLNVEKYIITRGNGNDMKIIGETLPAASGIMTFTDSLPDNNANYYQVIAIDAVAKRVYSNLVLVENPNERITVKVSPTILHNNNFNLSLSGINSGKVNLQLFNQLGQSVWTSNCFVNGTATNTFHISMDGINPIAGNYILIVSKDNKTLATQKLIWCR